VQRCRFIGHEVLPLATSCGVSFWQGRVLGNGNVTCVCDKFSVASNEQGSAASVQNRPLTIVTKLFLRLDCVRQVNDAFASPFCVNQQV
jgi:hypothetical protein